MCKNPSRLQLINHLVTFFVHDIIPCLIYMLAPFIMQLINLEH
jgi:hypothetical protein